MLISCQLTKRRYRLPYFHCSFISRFPLHLLVSEIGRVVPLRKVTYIAAFVYYCNNCQVGLRVRYHVTQESALRVELF